MPLFIILLESIKLQIKSQEIEPYLSGRCIYLVGQTLGRSTCAYIHCKYNYLGYSKYFESEMQE